MDLMLPCFEQGSIAKAGNYTEHAAEELSIELLRSHLQASVLVLKLSPLVYSTISSGKLFVQAPSPGRRNPHEAIKLTPRPAIPAAAV